MAPLKSSPAWKALQAHSRKIADRPMAAMFKADPGRFKRFSISRDGVLLDYSKNRITAEIMRLLVRLAGAADVTGRRDAMARGEMVNESEGRAALHLALRAAPKDRVGTKDARARALRERARIKRFAADVASGKRRGAGGKRYRTVLVLGVGGPHTGPAMAVAALSPYRQTDLGIRFVSSMDSAALQRGLDGLEPATTLVIVASKTFTTEETLVNARTVRAWLAKDLGSARALKQMAAVSANGDAVERFGIACDDTFLIWDWIGGRFSATSAMALPLALALGGRRFDSFLEGARAMDRHFLSAPLDRNMPVVMGMIGFWNREFLRLPALAVVPYDDRLRLLPEYLQQLVMESNGKSVDRDGRAFGTGGAPVVFGGAGTGVQHAFFQALHQGHLAVAVDFIAVAEDGPGTPSRGGRRRRLNANMLAHAEALMRGRAGPETRTAPHRRFPGDRPSNVILIDKLDPFALGQLVALYEHKVFVEAALCGLNPFDQWGVELGKELAASILPELGIKARVSRDHDSSTAGLIRRLRAKKPKRRAPRPKGKR